MAKQGNNGNRRKGTSKRAQAPARSRKRQPAAAPQSTETGLEPPASPPATESTESAQSARRQRRHATQPTPPTVPPAEQGPVPRGRRPRRPVEADAGSTPVPHAASEPEEPAPQPPVVLGAELAAHDTPILPVEVIDAATVSDEVLLEEPGGELGDVKATGRRARERTGPRSNALGTLIELRFADSMSPVRSYSELERRSGISREALSRYVTPRADRRRSPTIDTLAAIANAMHLSLEQVCRAAVAGAHGQVLPEQTVSQERDEMIRPFISMLSEEQFLAVIELLRQMQAHIGQS